MSMRRRQHNQYDGNRLVSPIRLRAKRYRLCWLPPHDRRSHLLWDGKRYLEDGLEWFRSICGIVLTHRMINRLVQSHQMVSNHLGRMQWILPIAVVQMPCSCECCPLLFSGRSRKFVHFFHWQPNLKIGGLRDDLNETTISIVPELVSISTFCDTNSQVDANWFDPGEYLICSSEFDWIWFECRPEALVTWWWLLSNSKYNAFEVTQSDAIQNETRSAGKSKRII